MNDHLWKGYGSMFLHIGKIIPSVQNNYLVMNTLSKIDSLLHEYFAPGSIFND
jgi:hypothetical protein